MKIIEDFKNYSENTPKVVSLGMFDGVHLGHLSIIQQLKKIAQKNSKIFPVSFQTQVAKMMGLT